MIIGNIILAILFFICGYMIRPYADELREISEVEKSIKDFVNEGKQMTNEEAIVILDHLGVKGSQDHTPHEIGEALTMAKRALILQKPERRPLIINNDSTLYCPCCGHPTIDEEHKQHYCWICGQEINWEDWWQSEDFEDGET